jgi:hypothetical protein
MRRLPLALLAVAAAGAAVATAGLGDSSSAVVFRGVDTGLCRFPFQVTVRTAPQSDQPATQVLQYSFSGPSRITLENTKSGRTVTLDSSGPYTVDTRNGSVAFHGHQVWFWSTGNHVPFATTDGTGALVSPKFRLAAGSSKARTVDPCALLSGSKPSLTPRATKAPWGLPTYALSRIGYAGLVPVIGQLVRHDHVHVDVIVNGRHVTIPAGVGMAEPRDHGPCPPSPDKVGDCTPGHVYVADVANSPLHTHSVSGIIHVEPDRKATYTLGQFFDEWGVRLTGSCLGGYCTGSGEQLRAYVNGRRVANPRAIVLTNRQEIALVYGGPGSFEHVPATYRGGWPGLGCGGPGEFTC